jgi:hypothetical protein
MRMTFSRRRLIRRFGAALVRLVARPYLKRHAQEFDAELY